VRCRVGGVTKRNRRQPICFSPFLYRARNLVERFFNRIKQCRRIATWYDKLAANYLAFIKLASIGIWRRLYESTRLVSGRDRDPVAVRRAEPVFIAKTKVGPRLPGNDNSALSLHPIAKIRPRRRL
jgi:hypothetical protein